MVVCFNSRLATVVRTALSSGRASLLAGVRTIFRGERCHVTQGVPLLHVPQADSLGYKYIRLLYLAVSIPNCIHTNIVALWAPRSPSRPLRATLSKESLALRMFCSPVLGHDQLPVSLVRLYLSVTMPPKKKEEPKPKKDKSKAIEDRTFGMKNKKGSAAQKQIKQISSSIQAGGSAEDKRKQAERAAREKEKKAAEDAKREAEALLNRPAQVQKVPFGVDPKTVVCIFYKKGNCEKGKKCKFAHDLSLERKTEKKNLYSDGRAEEEEKKKLETSEDWDEEKLRKVVLSKKGNQQTTTDKVCKYFIQAIEDGKYGWFWICPNGGDKCKYRHALPPG